MAEVESYDQLHLQAAYRVCEIRARVRTVSDLLLVAERNIKGHLKCFPTVSQCCTKRPKHVADVAKAAEACHLMSLPACLDV